MFQCCKFKSWFVRESCKQPPGVVYRIPCADCERAYVRQTGRTLRQRIKEHLKAVSTFNTDTSALVEHVLTEDHHIRRLGSHLHLRSTSLHTIPMLGRVLGHQPSSEYSEQRERTTT